MCNYLSRLLETRGDFLSLLCMECLVRAPHSLACCSSCTREMLTKAKFKSKEIQGGF